MTLRRETRAPVDLYAALAATPLLALLVEIAPGFGALRTLLGLPVLLLLPGYVLGVALFPAATPTSRAAAPATGHSSITGSERAILSVALSLILTPLLVLLVHLSPWPISTGSMLFALTVAIPALTYAAWVRRRRLPPEAQPRFHIPRPPGSLRRASRTDRALLIAAGLAALVLASSVAYAALAPRAQEGFTEFFVLSADGSFPPEPEPGHNATLLVGIRNHEHRPMDYRIVVRLEPDSAESRDDAQEIASFPVSLEAGASYERVHVFPLDHQDRARLVLELYREQDSAPYRSLRLWVDAPGEASNA